MITHNEITAGLWFLATFGSGAAGLLAGHWWWPSKRRLDDEYEAGWNRCVRSVIGRVEQAGEVFRLSPDGRAAWCDAGSQWDRDGAERAISFDADTPEPAAGPTVYPELVALGAQINAEPPEAISARLDETTEQWAARMDLQAAVWCAENGVEHDTAGVRS